jgi:SAM-dependent methyltransferase
LQQFPQSIKQPDDQGAPQGGAAYRMNWDGISDNYDQFVMCELEDTASYLDQIGIEPTDSVLDVCCGPGRITMLAAERAAHVTAIDLFPKMLEKAYNAGYNPNVRIMPEPLPQDFRLARGSACVGVLAASGIRRRQ